MHQRLRLRNSQSIAALTPFCGTLYRIAFAKYAGAVLDGVIHPEGRFHYDGQPALYASPSPETAAIAIDIYLKSDDAPRVMVPLKVTGASVVDLRDRATCERYGIDPTWPSVPWADQRAKGDPATSWKASDVVLVARTDEPTPWHPKRSL